MSVLLSGLIGSGTLHRIRAISFDLDDTLWAIGPVIERAEGALWSWFGEHYPRICEHWDDQSRVKLRDKIVRRHRDRAHDMRFLREATLREMATAAGYGTDLVQPAFEVFDRARNTVDLFPEVIPALERLRADFVLVALTNGNASLDVIGIRHLFAGVITATEIGVAKPARGIFDAACLQAGAQADEVLHVGDHPQIDIAGAKQAGLRAAWINRNEQVWPESLSPPDAVIAGLDELTALLLPSVAAR